jgi:hypothetical protein
MVLAKIQENIAAYKAWLKKERAFPAAYQWEILQTAQQHWDLTANPLSHMLDQCLQNSHSRRLWQDGNWQPKRMMMLFMDFEPEMVRAMFEDLFNEKHAAENRASRFVFGCDALLAEYKRANPTSIENNHDHGDFRMVALYLALQFPEQYAPYDFEHFREALIRLGARDIPELNDLGRYFKVLRTLMTFIEKDEELPALIAPYLKAHKHFQGRTAWLAADYLRFVAEREAL